MAVIEGAGLEPSETNLHQLADIFEDFRNRATASEEYKIAAEAAAKRAETAAQGVVTETAGKIKEIQAAGDAQVSRINSSGTAVEQSTQDGIKRLQTKLQELIANLQTVGGQEASAVRSAAQAILDDINLTKNSVDASAKQAQDSAASANASALDATQQATSAQSSATAAKASETKALASEGAAKSSETSAKSSEANAKASEQVAKESATSAQNSAKSAADSVTRVNAAAVLTTGQSLTPGQKTQVVQNLEGTFLPLTGGSITGDLRNALGGMYINDTSSSGGFKEFMLKANNGVVLVLRTNDSPRDAGSFALLPSDPVSGASNYYLLGLPNGDLLWGLQHIERVASKSDTWIRYENGLQVCWRNDYYSTKNQTIAFPVPFSKFAPACVLNGANICWTSNWEATAMHVQTNANEIGYISWVAIGVWK